MRYIKTNQPSCKLNQLHAKYTIIAILTLLTITLDLLRDLYKTIYIDLVKRVVDNPLLSQDFIDARLGLVSILKNKDSKLTKYKVEEILRVKNARGRGKHQALVKQKGQLKLIQELLDLVIDTAALEQFKAQHRDARYYNRLKRHKDK